MNMQQKILALALGIAMGSANAGTATGTVTVTGTVVASCTLNSPTAAFGTNVPSSSVATSQIQAVSIDVTCSNGTPWSLAVPASIPLTVGTDSTSNVLRLETTANVSLGTTPVTGTGNGVVQTQSLQVRAGSGTNGAAGIVGTGAMSGSIAMTVTY